MSNAPTTASYVEKSFFMFRPAVPGRTFGAAGAVRGFPSPPPGTKTGAAKRFLRSAVIAIRLIFQTKPAFPEP